MMDDINVINNKISAKPVIYTFPFISNSLSDDKSQTTYHVQSALIGAPDH